MTAVFACSVALGRIRWTISSRMGRTSQTI
nr:MAG TPA: hypothetical protein [Caudoviricetes sp.]